MKLYLLSHKRYLQRYHRIAQKEAGILIPWDASPFGKAAYEKWSERDSNPRPLHCERSALPTELPPHKILLNLILNRWAYPVQTPPNGWWFRLFLCSPNQTDFSPIKSALIEVSFDQGWDFLSYVQRERFALAA